MLTARAILGQYPNAFTHLAGDLELSATHCRSADEAQKGSLVFVSQLGQLAAVLACQPAIVVVDAALAAAVPARRRYGTRNCIVSTVPNGSRRRRTQPSTR